MDLIRILGGILLLPLPIAVLLLLAGTLLLWLGRRERLARWLVTGGTVVLVLASTAILPRLALGSLENDFPPYVPGGEADSGDASAVASEPAWIVVLCGGGGGAPGWPDLAGLSPVTLGRVAEGVRIAGLHPDARVLFTGGAVDGSRPCSDVMRGAAMELGLERSRILRDTLSRTTEDEARAIEGVVGDDPFVLVTAAWHLPRAVALVRARGLDPVPAPAAPRTAGPPPGPFRRLAPDATVLLECSVWAHEVVGRAWSKLRGRI